MATLTPNISLKKPAQDDTYNVDDFNGNYDTLDSCIGLKNNPSWGDIYTQLTYLRNNKSQIGHTHGINEITYLNDALNNLRYYGETYEARLDSLEAAFDEHVGGGGVSGDYLPLSGGTVSHFSDSRIVLCKDDNCELYVNANSSRIGIRATVLGTGIAVSARSMNNYSVAGDTMSMKGLNIAASTAHDNDWLSGNYVSSIPDENINAPSRGSWRIFSRIEDGVSYLYASVYDGTKWGAKHALTNYVLNQ